MKNLSYYTVKTFAGSPIFHTDEALYEERRNRFTYARMKPVEGGIRTDGKPDAIQLSDIYGLLYISLPTPATKASVVYTDRIGDGTYASDVFQFIRAHAELHTDISKNQREQRYDPYVETISIFSVMGQKRDNPSEAESTLVLFITFNDENVAPLLVQFSVETGLVYEQTQKNFNKMVKVRYSLNRFSSLFTTVATLTASVGIPYLANVKERRFTGEGMRKISFGLFLDYEEQAVRIADFGSFTGYHRGLAQDAQYLLSEGISENTLVYGSFNKQLLEGITHRFAPLRASTLTMTKKNLPRMVRDKAHEARSVGIKASLVTVDTTKETKVEAADVKLGMDMKELFITIENSITESISDETEAYYTIGKLFSDIIKSQN